MESVTKIAQKFFDDYAWTEEPKLDSNVGLYKATTSIK